ncbi:alkaline-phosphatase-like protein [Fusarium oxysporum]|nr:alkaline-phosphatase-like protein [Fusarium oxysporum]
MDGLDPNSPKVDGKVESTCESVLLSTFVASAKTRPNIILVLVDDQDLKKQMADEGTLYTGHYYFPRWQPEGLNSNYLPIWLQEAGYSTYYTGKFFNAHTVENYDKPHAAGWTSSDFLLDPFMYSYWNATWQRIRALLLVVKELTIPLTFPIRPSTTFGRRMLLASHSSSVVPPLPPHTEVVAHPGTYNGTITPTDPGIQPLILPPKPAKRHADMFRHLKVPRTPNFNPEEPSGVNWVAQRPHLNQTYIDYGDDLFRLRLESLQAVDETVDRIVKELESLDIMDNTYIIYTSDNGYHIGQYRLSPGKQCRFGEDINVPLLIRGPGVPKGVVSYAMTSHTDLATSIFRMTAIKPRPEFDGLAVSLTEDELERATQSRAEKVGIEFWGLAVDEGIDSIVLSNLNINKGIYLYSKDYNLYYIIYYINNKNSTIILITLYADSNIKINKKLLLGIISYINALIIKILYPDGNINSLKDIINNKYNSFYLQTAEKNYIGFDIYIPGYVITTEGPQDPSTY